MQSPDLLDPRAVLGALKARPGNAGASRKRCATAGLDRACARREDQAGRATASFVLVIRKSRPLASTAQAMRASLLASAIASTLWRRRFAGYATPYCLNQASIRAQASLAASAR